jgi:adenylosuccinate synthase
MPGIAVLGAQWGDEGKGKIAHLVSQDADYCVRFNGGTNAGHTVVFEDSSNGNGNGESTESEFKFHLIPSGAINKGCTGVMGNGMVLEPFSLAKEFKMLRGALGESTQIHISENAHLILPYHPIIESLEGSKSELDTTAKGIGPAYQDKVARRGLRAIDLLNPKKFSEKFARNLYEFKALFPESEALDNLETIKLSDGMLEAAETFKDSITNTTAILHNALDADKKVVFEGAQACLLDLDFGTYPYVTSSHATIGGISVGAGVPGTRIDRVIGITKAFTSRVGAGPFPTEDEGEVGERLRGTGANPWDEFGTTTGRPRRCGWLDLVSLKYAARVNGFTELVVVKLDILSDLDELKVATAYKLDGEVTTDFPSQADILERCEPVYETLPSWDEKIRGCRSVEDLPANAQNYVQFIEDYVGVPVSIISVGRTFEETITTG